MDVITGIDHAIIATGDLGAAEDSFARLGFAVTPRGLHSAHMGTANATTVFANGTYLELMGIVAPTERNAPFREGITAGRTLFGLALKTADAEAARDAFAAEGVDHGPVNAFARPVGLPDGEHEAAFRTANIAAVATPGAHAFVCEHLTPEVVWRHDYLEQPNAVTGLRAVVAVADDPAEVAEAWGRIAPGPVSTSGTKATVDFGNAHLEILTPDAFEPLFGAPPPNRPGLAALVLTTADVAATGRALAAAGVPDPSRLIAGPEHAAGVVLQFVAG